MEFKNVDEVLNAYAEYVVDSAKKNLVDERKSLGDLYKSVDKGVRGKTSTYPETAASLSQFQYGSGNFPKYGLRDGIKGWLEKKRFQWRDKKGKFMSYDTMTYLISRSIYNKGLKANLFFTTPFELGLQKLPKQLTDAFSLDIENAIILGTKK